MICNNKLISIITICLNSAKTIEGTISSVLNQSHENIEYLVVDGGSTDGTLEIIKKYEPLFNGRMKLISEKDNGIYDAMNKGVLRSSGDYMLFLNGGDSLFDSTVIKKFVETNPDSDIVYGDLLYDYKDVPPVVWKPLIENKKAFFFNGTIPHPSTFFKRELFMLYGLYDVGFKIAGDYEFVVRCVVRNKCKIKHIDIIIAVFDVNGISQTNRKEIATENAKIRDRYYSKFEQCYYVFMDAKNRLVPKIKSIVKRLVLCKR